MLAPTSNDVDDRLIVIPHTEWPQLREMYRRDWPTHIIGCYTLDTFVRWREAAPVANLTVYSLNGEWQVDGLYVCVVCEQPRLRYSIVIIAMIITSSPLIVSA